MALFESTLALLLGAVILTGVARRVGVPYPSLLAIAGAALAFVPAGPELEIEPELVIERMDRGGIDRACLMGPTHKDGASRTSRGPGSPGSEASSIGYGTGTARGEAAGGTRRAARPGD